MNKRLGILLALVLVMGLLAFAAVTQQKGSANSEADASFSVVTDVGSAEDYYPTLNSSYGGYPVPSPDGSLRLAGLTRNPDASGMLVVKTDFLYDGEGKLAGANRYFDAEASYKYSKLFFGIDEAICRVEADDQGRISKVTFEPGTESEWFTEFTYPVGGAMQSTFHRKTVNSDGSVYENDYTADDFDARDEIRKSQSELSPDSEFQYDEDGLVIKATLAERSDLDGKPMTKVYFYQYITDNNGFLEYVFGPGRIAFNKHGYLAEYPLVPAGDCYYEYRYAPAV